MKPNFLCGICVFSILLFSPYIKAAERKSYSAKDVFKLHSAQVCSLIALDASGREISSGTGFIYDDKRNIVTNRHVVAGGHAAVVECGDKRARIVGYIAELEGLDLLILRADSDLGEPLIANAEGYQFSEIGEEIFVIGNPLGLGKSIVSGIVSGIRRDPEDNVEYVQISAPINPGNSGGPVFNANGYVIGVATAKIRESEGIGLALSIRQVRQLVRGTVRPITKIKSERKIVDRENEDISIAFSGDVVLFRGLELGQPCWRLRGVDVKFDKNLSLNFLFGRFMGGQYGLTGWAEEEVSSGQIVDIEKLILNGHGVSVGSASLFDSNVWVMVQCLGGYFTKAAYIIQDAGLMIRAKHALVSKYGRFQNSESFKGVELLAAGESVIVLQAKIYTSVGGFEQSHVITYLDRRVSEVAVKKMRLIDLVRIGKTGEL